MRSSRVDFTGNLGEGIRLEILSESLDDFLPAFAMAGKNPPESLPVKLEGGRAQFQGILYGALAEPHLAGRLSTSTLSYKGVKTDQLSAGVDLSRGRLHLDTLSLRKNGAHLQGEATIGLRDYSPHEDAEVSGEVTLTGATLRTLIREARLDWDIDGRLSAAAKLSGSYSAPQALARVNVSSRQTFAITAAPWKLSRHACGVIPGR
jgi:autotransporter translocation and assembly factor TamB